MLQCGRFSFEAYFLRARSSEASFYQLSKLAGKMILYLLIGIKQIFCSSLNILIPSTRAIDNDDVVLR